MHVYRASECLYGMNQVEEVMNILRASVGHTVEIITSLYFLRTDPNNIVRRLLDLYTNAQLAQLPGRLSIVLYNNIHPYILHCDVCTRTLP